MCAVLLIAMTHAMPLVATASVPVALADTLVDTLDVQTIEFPAGVSGWNGVRCDGSGNSGDGDGDG